MNTVRRTLALAVGLALGAAVGGNALAQGQLDKVMKERGLTEKGILAAAKTYVPTGALYVSA